VFSNCGKRYKQKRSAFQKIRSIILKKTILYKYNSLFAKYIMLFDFVDEVC